ncbi:MAG: acyl carrier protein [Myxococcales bacterium]|nr:acyl carrier protein [Myxococcales bacterium]
MISQELKAVILRELSLDDFPLDDTTVASTVPGWDSLSHVRVISAVEEAFKVRFKALEVMKLKNVGELQALVDKKRG